VLEGKTSSIILAGSGVLWVSCLIYQQQRFSFVINKIERLRFLRYPTCDTVAGMMGRPCCVCEGGWRKKFILGGQTWYAGLCTVIVSGVVCLMHMSLSKKLSLEHSPFRVPTSCHYA
jgi:hypothetical protein